MNIRKIESIISAYKILKEQKPYLWIIDCSNAKSIKKAIELSATAKNLEGRKHPHQYRLPNSTLDSFAMGILDNVKKVKKARSFEELLDIIYSCKVKGVSHITIYDTAQRLGSYLKLYPEKVYLHGGTRTGAENLVGKIRGKSIEVNQLPGSFQSATLSAGEIEDLLWIYKDRLLSCG